MIRMEARRGGVPRRVSGARPMFLATITRMIGMVATGAVIAFGMASPAQARDKVTLMLNWYTYGEHAPFYLGVERGYFAAENIDLDIQEGRGSAVTVQAVAAGSTTLGYADVSTMIKAAAKGAPVVTVGVMLQKSPASVMGFADKNIVKPSDIKGRTVAMTPGDSLSQLWPVYLKSNHLGDTDYKPVSGDAATKRNAVVNGRADLLLGNVNDQKPIIEEITGKPVRALLFADAGVNPLNGGIIARKEMLKSNPDLLRRFLRAAVKSVQAATQSPQDAVNAMLKINSKAGKPETLAKSWEATIPLLHTASTQNLPPLRFDPKDMAATLDLMVKYGGVDGATAGKAEDYYTLEFLPK
ncbi:ABC transporter substrate-binding protein [Pandoraea apista]|uniref:ABC transporter substrate-binding protein n=1 Tax=Pandoraea apista TaxID=93218 RepID=UPI00065A50E9|nr:ABC transporter substrate-binding protein [Pandoraea apista]CFB61226.1 Putative thiamine biosynthesis protein [Pandoraea apista]